MAKKRVFISFDYDNDEEIKMLLAGQAKHGDSPFDFTDASVKEHMTGDWKDKVRRRLRNCDVAIILCGERTHTASGVSAELEIIKDLGLPYFLLAGRSDKSCTKPQSAHYNESMYRWSWDNLKKLIEGYR